MTAFLISNTQHLYRIGIARLREYEYFNNSIRIVDEKSVIDFSNDPVFTDNFCQFFITALKTNSDTAWGNVPKYSLQEYIDLIMKFHYFNIDRTYAKHTLYYRIIKGFFQERQCNLRLDINVQPGSYFIYDFMIVFSMIRDYQICAVNPLLLVKWHINFSKLHDFYKHCVEHGIDLIILDNVAKSPEYNRISGAVSQQFSQINTDDYITDTNIMIDILKAFTYNNEKQKLLFVTINSIQYMFLSEPIKQKIKSGFTNSEATLLMYDRFIFV